jgi:hypothetical protein
LMNWKFCAMLELGNVPLDCAKTGDMPATDAIAAAKTSRFIQWPSVVLTSPMRKTNAKSPIVA